MTQLNGGFGQLGDQEEPYSFREGLLAQAANARL